MGVVWLKVAFWASFAGFCGFVVGLLAWRLGELYGRSGVGWWKRVVQSDDVIRCRMCGAEHAVQRHHRETDTCGHVSCIARVMTGRARMAEARQVSGFHLVPKLVQGKWKDGSDMFTSAGEPVMVPDPSGEWVRVPGLGGTARQLGQDAAALKWISDRDGA